MPYFRMLLATLLLVATPTLAHETYKLGDLTVTQVWGRAAPVHGRPSSAYFTVTNTGSTVDRLIAAESPAAERVELHAHEKDGTVMRMRAIDVVPVPAGETVTFAPGGLHVMLMKPARSMGAGETIPLTLVFERAGRLEVAVPLSKPGAQPTHHSGH